ncbi:MAG: hypothetical protein HQQ73_00960 [Desulfobulbaceae bacterium]|nr:hypothetical protein [Desulfobulbaceae bacterium]
MKTVFQLAASCCLVLLATSGIALGAATAPKVSAEEIQKNLDTLLVTRACPSCNFAGAELIRMKLAGVNLEGANLTGARLLLTDLAGANLRNANLSGANLGGADLARADLSGARLDGAVLEGAFISPEQIQSATGYVPEKRIQIPVTNLPAESASASATASPDSLDSAMAPSMDATDYHKAPAALKTQPTPVTGPEEGQDASPVTSKSLPVAPTTIPTEETLDARQTETASPMLAPAPAQSEEKSAPLAEGNATVSSTRTSDTSAKPLPISPGTLDTPSANEQGLPSPAPAVAQESPETELAPPGQSEVTAVVPSEAQPAPIEEELAPPTTEPAASPDGADETIAMPAPSSTAEQLEEEIVDGHRDQFIKQLFKQKQCIDCNLSQLDFAGRSFRKFDLERANFQGSNLTKADLRSANLKGANLSGALLQGADLRKADLYRANLRGADLTDARLNGALLDSADLSGASGYMPTQATTD